MTSSSSIAEDENDYFREWSEHHVDERLLSKLLDQGVNTDTFFEKVTNSSKARYALVKKYAWAVPTEKALRVIAKYAPIVELGAGTGYWAYLLQKRGIMIVAFDKSPPSWANNENDWHRGAAQWTDVKQGSTEVLERYRYSTLFLCWPPYNDVFAYQALREYKGKHVIYIGEENGCTADEAFQEDLKKNWVLIEEVAIPQWWGIHDRLEVFARKGKK